MGDKKQTWKMFIENINFLLDLFFIVIERSLILYRQALRFYLFRSLLYFDCGDLGKISEYISLYEEGMIILNKQAV